MQLAERIIGVTFVLVAIYLFVFNADNTTKVLNSLGNAYMGAVRTLQGQQATKL